MDEVIGRIKWTGLDISSKETTDGDLPVQLEDVVFETGHTTRKHDRYMELIRDILPNDPGMMAKLAAAHQVLEEEVARGAEDFDRITQIWHKKQLRLGDHYSLDYSEHPHSAGTGFGLSGERDGIHCFSWDWFNVVAPGKATKLQESGEVSFEVGTTPCGEEIVWMHFDTDVSIRIAKFGDEPTKHISWRINIHQGSEIFWPSLVDGVLVSNGYLG